MRVTISVGELAAADSTALGEFEAQFTYPLGADARFAISHCGDHLRFFSAMGEACCIVARRGDAVLGAMSMAVRRLLLADGTTRKVGYLGDLKIAPAARGGLVLARLAREATRWLESRVEAALGIVMGGTGVVPTMYTGRAGLPKFAPVGQVTLLRLATEVSPVSDVRSVSLFEAARAFAELSRGRMALPLEQAVLRSEIAPEPLMLAQGTACGVLEDTRRAKRLTEVGGRELVSAHLSAFAYREAQDGALLLRDACRRAAEQGFPALFASIASPDADAMLAALGPCKVTVAAATVYGANLGAHDRWNINTSEI